MNRVVHFEIQANDIERAKKFYGDVFGWEFPEWMHGVYWGHHDRAKRQHRTWHQWRAFEATRKNAATATWNEREIICLVETLHVDYNPWPEQSYLLPITSLEWYRIHCSIVSRERCSLATRSAK